MPTIALNSSQRAFLRKTAHHLHPLVSLGKAGYGEAIAKALAESLAAHELVKVKFHDFTDEKQEICRSLEEACDATLVSITGNVALFFRPNPDPARRTVVLPRPKAPHA